MDIPQSTQDFLNTYDLKRSNARCTCLRWLGTSRCGGNWRNDNDAIHIYPNTTWFDHVTAFNHTSQFRPALLLIQPYGKPSYHLEHTLPKIKQAVLTTLINLPRQPSNDKILTATFAIHIPARPELSWYNPTRTTAIEIWNLHNTPPYLIPYAHDEATDIISRPADSTPDTGPSPYLDQH